jgi:hypothetical protein
MGTPTKGWIINLDRDDSTSEVVSDQQPLFVMQDGAPCYEVWKWHATLGRWFVMSYRPNPSLAASGVIYYTPEEVPNGLRKRMRDLEQQHAGEKR